ncbi:MAG: cupredoxin domain-containing protein [Candidatus Nealsonbacteria bacterium]|nr:cupredoxin domain-containing protein [Candidatus Nealsonbacteria bacterium]
MNKIITISFIIFLFAGLAFLANAQEEVLPASNVNALVAQDEAVLAGDLGVGDSGILPDSPFYFFKNTFRGVRSALTFNQERKAELKLQFANEKIIEAQKLAEKGNFKVLEKHLKNYEKDVEGANKIAENLKDKNPEFVEKFSEKSLGDQLKHQVLLGNFEKEAPLGVIAGIKETRGKTIEHLGGVIENVKDQEKIKEVVATALSDEGSSFKPLRNLEVLKAVEEKVPEQAKDAIRQAQENSLKRFKEKFEQLPKGQRELLGDYVQRIGGDEVRYVKVFDHMKFVPVSEEAQKNVNEAKEKFLNGFEQRLNEARNENPELVKEFLSPINDGTVEGLRALKDIEDNFDPALSSKVLEVKQEAIGKFRTKIDFLDTQDKVKEFVRESNERFADVKQVEVFEDIKEALPEDKQNIAEDLKEGSINRIKEQIQGSRSSGERAEKVRALVDDNPDNIGVIKGMQQKLGAPISQELMFNQVKRIEQKIEFIEDPGKLKVFEEKIRLEPGNRSTVEQFRPNLIEKVEVRSENVLKKNIKEEEAKARIDNVETNIQSLKEEADGTFQKISDEAVVLKYKRLFNEKIEEAAKHIQRAKDAFEQGNFGKSFGESTSALNLLRGAKEILLRALSITEVRTVPMPAVKPAEQKSIEVKPAELKPVEAKPIEIPRSETETKEQPAVEKSQFVPEKGSEDIGLKIEQIPFTVNVSIKGFSFSPSVVEVAAGGKVIFKNNDSVLHNVRGQLSLRDLKENDTAELIVPKTTGSYEYFCGFHPNMKGKIIVK